MSGVLNVLLSESAVTTASISSNGPWITSNGSVGVIDVVSIFRTITVPVGSAGSLKFSVTGTGVGTMQYAKNGSSSYATFSANQIISGFVNGDTLNLRLHNAVSGSIMTGNILDSSTMVSVNATNPNVDIEDTS